MYIRILFLVLALSPSVAFCADIFVADRQFTEKNYAGARESYLAAAKLGNPHAYYQLANIYYKGLGTDKDVLNALIYFYLAAEQKFHNAEYIVDKILNSIPPENKDAVIASLEEYKLTQGKQRINEKYFPVIDSEKLTIKVTFEGKETLETIYHPDDIDLEELNPDLGYDTFYNDSSDEDEEDSLNLLMSTPKTPFLIIDHDVHTDGTVRYTSEVQKFGLHKKLLDQFSLFPISKPEFNGKPAEFASRSYLGAAAYDKFTLVRENEKTYARLLKQVRQFKSGTTISDQFNLAMLMLNFPWIDQADNEAENILHSLAKQGHSPAMYEYGFKLYREQRDIQQAIYWISEASKYGLVRAEYRLAKILQTSPWVNNDERKALFWYQSAMEKGDIAATIRATEILLMSKDESLLNRELATSYLQRLSESQSRNPEFYYLTALTYRNGADRNIKLTVENLKRAISMAQFINWDVSEWEDLLDRITTGNVYVTDE